MGAKFAPSYANLFLAAWENEKIWNQHKWRPFLKIWLRYIDDVLFIWTGSRETLEEFCTYLNHNEKNIKFTFEISQERVNFLDLTIFPEEARLKVRNFIKPTDCNSFINKKSCHHKNWLKNIPKGQLRRLRRNCTDEDEFLRQSDILNQLFIEKGYEESELNNFTTDIRTSDRRIFLESKPREAAPASKNDFSLAFITQFNSRHREIEQIIKRNWHLLLKDPILSEIIPLRPKFIYRRAQNLGNKLTSSAYYKPISSLSNITSKGFYRCGTCLVCRTHTKQSSKIMDFTSNRTGQNFKINQFITCSTMNVIYLIECECGKQYVGRTGRPLKVRWAEHINNIKKGFLKHSVSNHFKTQHSCSITSIAKMIGIERINIKWRESNVMETLAKTEMKWIFNLDTMHPKGLNSDFELKWFL